VAIVSLPTAADERIDRIPATEFDPLFDPHFRLGWPEGRSVASPRFAPRLVRKPARPGANRAGA
jgi:hypothetical protein